MHTGSVVSNENDLLALGCQITRSAAKAMVCQTSVLKSNGIMLGKVLSTLRPGRKGKTLNGWAWFSKACTRLSTLCDDQMKVQLAIVHGDIQMHCQLKLEDWWL